MPNGKTVVSAYVQIVPSAEGIKGSITQALGGEASSAGESLGSTLVGKIKGVIAAAGIGAAIGKTLTEGAALEQSIGGVETLFKDSADTIKQYAAQAYSTAGVSANSYMEQVTSFSATLLQGLGGDTAAAAKYANEAIVQMSDNANKMGTDISSIQWAYQGFAKDNFTMLDNLKLGYGGTQAEMARLINDSGVLGDTVEVTAQTVKDVPFDKIIEAIQVIQDNLGITGTTANEAATTFSGSLASMQAAASNVMGALMLGQDLKPALNGLATTMTTFLVGNLLPALWNILSALPSALVTFIQSLVPQLATQLQTFVSGIVPQISAGITQTGPQLLASAQGLLSQFQTAVTTYLPNLLSSGMQIVQQIVTGVTTGLPNLLSSGMQIVQQIVTGVTTGLPSLLQAATSLASQFLSTLVNGWAQIQVAAYQIIPLIVNGILETLPSLISTAGSLVSSFVGSILAQLPSVLTAGVQMLVQIVQGIAQNLPQIANSAISTVTQFVATILANLPQILQTGISLIGQLVAGLIRAIPDVIAAIPQILAGIVDTFMSYDWLGLGVDIIKGIGAGILDAGGSLVSSIIDVSKDAFNSAKNFFGINSPSHLMRYDFGPFIPQGMALGITDNEGLVQDAMDELSAIPARRMRTTLATAAANPPQLNPVPSAPAGSGISYDQLLQLFNMLIAVIRENGGEIVIGDDVIGRANARYMQDRSIVTGGAVF